MTNELERFREIHIQFGFHPCVLLSRIYPHLRHQFAFLVNISLVKITETCCNICNYPTNALVRAEEYFDGKCIRSV
jgi:hypothetical protein